MQKKHILAGLAGLGGAIGAAFAEPPAAVNTAITGAGTDAAAVASAILVAVVGLLAFKYMRSQLK